MDIYQQEMAFTSASNLLDLLARWILLSKKFLAPPTPISPTSMLTSLASWLRPGMDDNCPSLLQIYFKNMILFIRGPVDWEGGPVDWGAWETWMGDIGYRGRGCVTKRI